MSWSMVLDWFDCMRLSVRACGGVFSGVKGCCCACATSVGMWRVAWGSIGYINCNACQQLKNIYEHIAYLWLNWTNCMWYMANAMLQVELQCVEIARKWKFMGDWVSKLCITLILSRRSKLTALQAPVFCSNLI